MMLLCGVGVGRGYVVVVRGRGEKARDGRVSRAGYVLTCYTMALLRCGC